MTRDELRIVEMWLRSEEYIKTIEYKEGFEEVTEPGWKAREEAIEILLNFINEKRRILEPCKICGGQPKIYENSNNHLSYSVACKNHDCPLFVIRTRDWDTEQEAIDEWNRAME